MTNLTPDSLALFLKIVTDSSVEDFEGCGILPDLTEAERGNLTDLKKKDLLFDDPFEVNGRINGFWVTFLPAGQELAAAHGITNVNWEVTR